MPVVRNCARRKIRGRDTRCTPGWTKLSRKEKKVLADLRFNNRRGNPRRANTDYNRDYAE